MPIKNDVFFTAGSGKKYIIYFGPSYFVRALVLKRGCYLEQNPARKEEIYVLSTLNQINLISLDFLRQIFELQFNMAHCEKLIRTTLP